ncbi:hypothetical protein NQZ68_025197 [Dissostichus eleginoides]|nr:hypothetical protein NQZ68_025197 [Dissostichus eleginoides]
MDSLATFRRSNSEILDKITRKSNKRNAVIAERPEHRRDEQKGQYGSLIWEIKPQIPDLIRMALQLTCSLTPTCSCYLSKAEKHRPIYSWSCFQGRATAPRGPTLDGALILIFQVGRRVNKEHLTARLIHI